MSAFPRLRPRHRWFSSPCREAEDGWFGPHKTFEGAAAESAAHSADEGICVVFVTTGRKLTKAEREEMGVEYDWECDAQNAVEVRLNPKAV